MSQNPLIIDAQAHALVYALIAHATHHTIDHAALKQRHDAFANGEEVQPYFEHRIHLPLSYLATFTIEEQIPGIMFRHLSVALASGSEGQAPHPDIVGEIMAEFGFHNDRENVHGWIEPLEDGRCAVNVLEPIDGDWSGVPVDAPTMMDQEIATG